MLANGDDNQVYHARQAVRVYEQMANMEPDNEHARDLLDMSRQVLVEAEKEAERGNQEHEEAQEEEEESEDTQVGHFERSGGIDTERQAEGVSQGQERDLDPILQAGTSRKRPAPGSDDEEAEPANIESQQSQPGDRPAHPHLAVLRAAEHPTPPPSRRPSRRDSEKSAASDRPHRDTKKVRKYGFD